METIFEALRIDEASSMELFREVIESMRTEDTVADSIRRLAKELRTREFGPETAGPVSMYELKLVLTGFMLAALKGQLERAADTLERIESSED